MRYVFILLVLALTWLAACAAPAPMQTPSVCPPVQTYSRAQDLAAQAEYNALPKDSTLRTFIDDYKVERAKLRACRAHAG